MRISVPTSIAVAASLLVAMSLNPLCAIAQSPKPAKDFTDIDPVKIGVKLLEARKDAKTGFMVAGKNSTDLLKSLTEINGRTIAALETDMRPGAKAEVGSEKGFLGATEGLLSVLADDNRY